MTQISSKHSSECCPHPWCSPHWPGEALWRLLKILGCSHQLWRTTHPLRTGKVEAGGGNSPFSMELSFTNCFALFQAHSTRIQDRNLMTTWQENPAHLIILSHGIHVSQVNPIFSLLWGNPFGNLTKLYILWRSPVLHCQGLPLQITNRCLLLSSQMPAHQQVFKPVYLYTEYATALNLNEGVFSPFSHIHPLGLSSLFFVSRSTDKI